MCLAWVASACSAAPPEEGGPEVSGDRAPLPPPAAAPTPQAPPPAGDDTRALPLDVDGVVMVLPPAPGGSSWSLGEHDPNHEDATYFDLDGDAATGTAEGGLRYWSTPGHPMRYASGGLEGRTARFNIRASGGVQTFSWESGALEQGYIGNPLDLRNLEATVYVRVRGNLGTPTSMTWKLRGGRHTATESHLASCTGMTVPFGTDAPSAYRELDHPYYDFVPLTPRFPFQLQEGRWLGVKVLSYVVEGGTHNLLYLDPEPFDADGRPRNGFRLYTEWSDRDGVPTGRYHRAATWGGWLTTFRVDGWQNVDVAILSVREVLPPQPHGPPLPERTR